MANPKARRKITKVYTSLVKPVSPEINGVVYPRWLVPGRELESVLIGIRDGQAILSHRCRFALCEAMTVLDAARRILAWKMDKQ